MFCYAGKINRAQLQQAKARLKPVALREQDPKYAKATKFVAEFGPTPFNYENRRQSRAKHSATLAKSHEAYLRRKAFEAKNFGKKVEAQYNGDGGVINQRARSKLNLLSGHKGSTKSWTVSEGNKKKKKEVTAEKFDIGKYSKGNIVPNSKGGGIETIDGT